MIRRDFLTYGLASLASLEIPTLPADGARADAAPRLSSSASALPTVAAGMADDVCESYMVNTKLFYNNSVYQHTEAVIDLIKELGARIVRERVTTGGSRGTHNQQRAMLELADAGTRWHGTVGSLEDWQHAGATNRAAVKHLDSYYRPRVGDLTKLMHSLGGCNEIDGPVLHGRNDPEWAKHARIMQQALWREVKANRATRDIPVAGPSTRTDVTRARAAELGDLSAWCDMGNAHMYNKGGSPTEGIDEHLDILSRCFPDARRWVFTETGYNDSPQDNTGRTVPEWAPAYYLPRGICDFYKRKVIYGRFELLDDPDPIDHSSQSSINRTANREAHFGLVAMTKSTVGASTPGTWRKKPEFYATQRFLRLMEDRGPAFRPDGLQLDVTGGRGDLQQALVQKRDGRHYLLLWRDVDVCEIYPSARRIPVSSHRITVRLGTQRPMAVYEPRSDQRPVDTFSARSSIGVDVAGDLVVVEIG